MLHHTLSFATENETAAFGAALAPLLGPGDVLLLEGEIGAGKTHFARSLIKARLASAGVDEDVPSPTYTLIQTYDDRICEIWHADLYRLSDPAEYLELGLDEAFETAVCLVEWPEALGPFRPDHALTLAFEIGRDPQRRTVQVRGPKGRWEKTLRQATGSLRTT